MGVWPAALYDRERTIPRDFGRGYFNGYPSGRIAYLGAVQKLQEFYEQVWREPSWKFRRPASLDELAAFVKLELETTNTLFTSSDYPTPYIGGGIRIEKITAPSGTMNL